MINFHFLREIKKPVIFLGILFVFSLWLGYYSGQVHPAEANTLLEKLSKDLGTLKNVNAVAMFLFIFFNNAVKSFAMAMLGTFFGVIPVLFIIVNGLLIGVTSSVIVARQGMEFLFVGTAPHGILEIPAFLIAGAYGLRLGRKYYRSLRFGDPFKPLFFRVMREMTRIVLPMLVVASFIETFITTALLRSL
jgi:stage II sporulation protein M